MTRLNDIGGVQGFGPLTGIDETSVAPVAQAYGPDGRTVWEADWQARIWALVIALGINGVCSASELRDAEERAAPHDFLAASYYERVVMGIERILRERGLLEAG
nr:nitrile hydratase subunit beta [Streptomyces sp. NBC_00857]